MKKKLLAFAMTALSAGVLSADAATVYFLNDDGWEEVCAYSWNDGSEGNPKWPGAKLTSTVNVGGKEYYNIDLDTQKVIFNNNNKGKQTTDLNVEDGAVFSKENVDSKYPIGTIKNGVFTPAGEVEITYAKIYIPASDWEYDNCYIYTWEPSIFGGWPGKEMTKVTVDNLSEGNPSSYWMIEVDESDINDRTIKGWKLTDNKGKESVNITSGTIFQNGYVYHLDGTSHPLGQHSPIVTDTYPEMYLVGAMTGWGKAADYKMATTDGVTYTLTCTLEASKEFKFFGGDWGTRELTIDNQELGDGTYDLTPGDKNMALKNGGDVTFTLVQSNNFASAKLTIAGGGEVEPDEFTPVYFLSDRYAFAKNPNFKMETTDGITYTLNIPDAGSDIAFKFLAETTPAKHFSNGQQNIHNGTFTLSDNTIPNMTLHTGGNVNITVKNINNFSSIEVTIEGQDHDADPFPPIYLVGDMNEWHTQEAYRLSTEDGVNYKISVPNMSGDANFKFMGGDAHNFYFSNGSQNMPDGTYELNTNSETGNMSLATGGDVTFTFVLGDMHHTATLTIEGQGEVVPDEYPAMYLTSERYGWGAKDKLKMQTTDGKTYTLNVPDMSTSPFKFHGGDWGIRELTGAGQALANGEYALRPGSDNMTLGVGGNVTFTIEFPEAITEDTKTVESAKLTIAGQEGEIVRNVTYALYGQFKTETWAAVPLTKVEGEDDVWTATFTLKNTPAQFGVQMLVNGEQVDWYNEDVTFSASNTSATLTLEAETEQGKNCTFDGTLDTEYTATWNATTHKLSFTGFSDEPTPVDPTGNEFYVKGNIFGDPNWSLEKMTLTDGKYVLADKTIQTGSFGIAELDPSITEGDQQVKWYAAANAADEEVELNKVISIGTIGTTNLHIYAGTYTFTFDPEALTLTVTGTQTEFPSEGFDGWTVTLAGDHNGFNTDDASNTVTVSPDGKAEISTEDLDANTGFKFVVKHGNEATWYGIKGDVALNTPLELGDTGYYNPVIPDASKEFRHTFNLDLAAKPYKVTITRSNATGIESIEAADSDAIYFDLQGVQVKNPSNGLYIRVKEGKAAKVMVK